MLFDLRSGRRRRTVQVVYCFLALLMVGGLLLVGVGTGSGGGILNAFTNNGSGNDAGQVVRSTETKARKLADANPSNAGDWDTLVQDDWSAAGVAPDFNGKAFTAKGQAQLKTLESDWAHYLTLAKNPDSGTAIIVSRADYALGDYAGQAAAWEIFAKANPTSAEGFECIAAAAFRAKETQIAKLAVSQALAIVPKAQKLTVTSELAESNAPQLDSECFSSG